MRRHLLAAVAAPCLLVACSPEPIVVPERAATPIDSSQTGSVAGSIRYLGEAGPPEALRITGAPGCSQLHSTPLEDESLLVEDGRVRNAFVYVQSGLESYVFEIPHSPVVLDQVGCRFEPHVIGVQRYRPITVKNSDPLLHNVRTRKTNSRPLNLALPASGDGREVQFTEDDVMVELICDLHPWMRSYVGVVDHPFFAVSDATGAFRLDGLPAGEYTLGVWHEELGVQEVPFRVEAGGVTELLIEYAPLS